MEKKHASQYANFGSLQNRPVKKQKVMTYKNSLKRMYRLKHDTD